MQHTVRRQCYGHSHRDGDGDEESQAVNERASSGGNQTGPNSICEQQPLAALAFALACAPALRLLFFVAVPVAVVVAARRVCIRVSSASFSASASLCQAVSNCGGQQKSECEQTRVPKAAPTLANDTQLADGSCYFFCILRLLLELVPFSFITDADAEASRAPCDVTYRNALQRNSSVQVG